MKLTAVQQKSAVKHLQGAAAAALRACLQTAAVQEARFARPTTPSFGLLYFLQCRWQYSCCSHNSHPGCVAVEYPCLAGWKGWLQLLASLRLPVTPVDTHSPQACIVVNAYFSHPYAPSSETLQVSAKSHQNRVAVVVHGVKVGIAEYLEGLEGLLGVLKLLVLALQNCCCTGLVLL